MCDVTIKTIDDWGLRDDIKAFTFDMTAANSGRLNGVPVCALLEAKLDKGALCLSCCHHIHEIVLEEVFSSCLGPSSAPEIQVFKRLKKFWPNFVHIDFSPRIRDELDVETSKMIL